ncbi:MAG: hypothetical protein R3Y05_01575 [bacterium]
MKQNEMKFIKPFKEDIAIETIENLLNGEKDKELEEELSILKTINIGEQVVYFELSNTYLNINVFHNITLDGNTFDYILIDNNFICSITCMNIQEDYEMNEYGEIFISNESIGNPFIASREKLKYLEDLLTTNKLINDIEFISLIVNTNKKAVKKRCTAPEYITKHFINSDDLTCVLSELDSEKRKNVIKDKMISKINEFILNNDNPIIKDYEFIKEPSLLQNAKEEFSNKFNQFKKFSIKTNEKLEKYTTQISKEIFETIEEDDND